MRKRGNKGGFILVCLFVAGVALTLSYVFDAKLEPLIMEMGKAKVEYAAKLAMNDAVTELMDEGEVNYDRIISFEKDASGGITAVKTDVSEVNRLKAGTTTAVLDSISSISIEDLSVPIGNLSSMDFLSGRGPGIPVRIIAVRTIGVDFLNDFQSGGINQTIHRIYLSLDMEITILAAGKKDVLEAKYEYCVAETVIVGTVPDSYTYFSETDSAKDAAENYFNFS